MAYVVRGQRLDARLGPRGRRAPEVGAVMEAAQQLAAALVGLAVAVGPLVVLVRIDEEEGDARAEEQPARQ